MTLSRNQKLRLANRIDLLTCKGETVTANMIHETLDEWDYPEMTNKQITTMINKSKKNYGR